MSKMISIFILSLFPFLYVSSQKIDKSKVVLAINCGGDEYVDSNGITYEEDNYFDTGKTSDHGLNYDISNTEDQELYQTERWSPDTLTYSLPLRNPGKYVLILKFSEVYFQRANEKIFDIALGKNTVIKNLDIFAKVGHAAALDEFIEFELKSNGKVFINESKELKEAYDSKEKVLKLKFLKGKRDNPKINAILLIKGGIKDTNYAEKKKQIDETNKKKKQEENKKYAVELRHHPDEVFEEETLLNEDIDTLNIVENTNIMSIFNTKPGFGILASVVVFFVFNHGIDLII